MDFLRTKTAVMTFYFFFISSSAFSKSLWNDKNIYSSGSNLKVGDIVTVKVKDISQMRFAITIDNNNSFSITSNPDKNVTGFLPGISSDRKINNSDKTNFSGKGNMEISIAAQIVNDLKNGKYRISGAREYSFSGIKNSFFVSGIIDSSLMEGRIVFSDDIAEFRLEVRGTKEGAKLDLKREKLKEGESASNSLTEEEKQKIILDYLEKMIRELTR